MTESRTRNVLPMERKEWPPLRKEKTSKKIAPRGAAKGKTDGDGEGIICFVIMPMTGEGSRFLKEG